MDIVRQSGITDGVPLFIDYWPEKEVHHFITSKKEVDALLPDGPRLEEVFATHKNLLRQEEAKALRNLKRLSRIAKDRMGNGRRPNPWPPISEQATRLWEPKEYIKYQGLHRLYHLDIKHRLNAFRQCEETGRKLLLIEERQEKRIERVGLDTLLKRETFSQKYEQLALDATGISPTDEEVEDAWISYEQKGSYTFRPNGNDEVYIIRV